jgi:hypothetical protein
MALPPYRHELPGELQVPLSRTRDQLSRPSCCSQRWEASKNSDRTIGEEAKGEETR